MNTGKASNAYLHPSTLTFEERELIGDFWIEMLSLIKFKHDIKKSKITKVNLNDTETRLKINVGLSILNKKWKSTYPLYPKLNEYLDNIKPPISEEQQYIIDKIKEIIQIEEKKTRHTTERPLGSAYGGHKQRHTTRRSKSKRSSVKKGKRSSVKKGKRSSVKK